MRLWRSITQTLKDAPAAVSADGVKPTIIEIEVVINDYSARYWMSTFYGWPRPEEDKRLTLTKYVYGFDVADSYFISGLSNCMLSSVELSYLRTLWSHRINNFGLIPEVTDALEYCQVCDRLIPEHAPFYAFRIQSVDIGLEPPT